MLKTNAGQIIGNVPGEGVPPTVTLRRFLRIGDVCAATGLPPSSVYEKMAAGAFPKSFALGSNAKARAWLEDEVAQWQAERLAEREAV